MNLTENVNKCIDRGDVVGLVTLDLEKAFDMINHEILLSKLKCYGFDDDCLNWVRDYFRLRTQITVINGNESCESVVHYGIAQGSILGPLLFILYMNDLSKVVKNCKVSLYADDTCLYVSSKDPVQMQTMINEDLASIQNWLSHNELLLNVKKCKLIIIGTKHKTKSFNNVKVRIDDYVLDTVDKCNYLGVILDKEFSWKAHIDSLRSKILRNLFMLRRLRPYIDVGTATLLYHTMIHPHFDYCNTIWMKLDSTPMKRLQILQNRALRIVLQVDCRFNRLALYTQLSIDCLNVKVKKDFVILVFKLLNNLLPNVLCSKLVVKQQNYSLRNIEQIILLPKPHTNPIQIYRIYQKYCK